MPWRERVSTAHSSTRSEQSEEATRSGFWRHKQNNAHSLLSNKDSNQLENDQEVQHVVSWK